MQTPCHTFATLLTWIFSTMWRFSLMLNDAVLVFILHLIRKYPCYWVGFDRSSWNSFLLYFRCFGLWCMQSFILCLHFSPPLVPVQCYAFNNANQKEGERIEFFAVLWRILERCAFGDQLEDMLCDWLICRVWDKQIQKCLLSKAKDLTFLKARLQAGSRNCWQQCQRHWHHVTHCSRLVAFGGAWAIRSPNASNRERVTQLPSVTTPSNSTCSLASSNLAKWSQIATRVFACFCCTQSQTSYKSWMEVS